MFNTQNKSDVFKKYQKQWVAFTDDDRFITAGLTLDEVLTKAKKKGFDNSVTTKIPDLKFEFIL